MSVQVAVAVVVAAVAVGIALVLRRRQAVDPPTQARHQVPAQLDRGDFDGADADWLVVLFSSASCGACADVWRKAVVLASAEVAVVEAEHGARPDLHRRYGIDAVPTLVFADRDGVVQASFLGPVTATDLWAASARLRAGDEPACGG